MRHEALIPVVVGMLGAGWSPVVAQDPLVESTVVLDQPGNLSMEGRTRASGRPPAKLSWRRVRATFETLGLEKLGWCVQCLGPPKELTLTPRKPWVAGAGGNVAGVSLYGQETVRWLTRYGISRILQPAPQWYLLGNQPVDLFGVLGDLLIVHLDRMERNHLYLMDFRMEGSGPFAVHNGNQYQESDLTDGHLLVVVKTDAEGSAFVVFYPTDETSGWGAVYEIGISDIGSSR